MNKLILGVGLLLASTACMAQGDIWSKLFQEKLRDAGQGDSEAQYDVGTMYQNGRGVTASRTSAIEWYNKAAAKGNPQAISRLKLMHENESRFKKTQAESAKGDRESQYELGNMYTKGIGVDIDYKQAIAAYEKSAGQGFDKAAYRLGLIYYEGTGIKQNMATAFKWFSTAAESSYPAAQYHLGKMYAAGEGTRKNNDRALEWLSKAVDGGFDQARGAMINVSENITMEAAKAAARAEQAAAESAQADKAGKSRAPARRVVKTSVSRRSTKASGDSKSWGIEDLMLAAWNRDSEPVTYLPSSINNCRIEDDKLVCFSDDQTQRLATNLIKFKTKAIIDNFSSDGTFEVTYRNLVIDATRLEDTESGDDATGDDNPAKGYTVKTGWGTPHTLECKFKDDSTLSCLKNKSHSFVLTSPQNLAAGK